MEKYIPLSVPNFEGNEQKYVNDAVQQGWVSTGGAYVKEFEKKLAEYLHTDDVAVCQSGTAALHLALISCRVMPGDMVIVPTLTFIAAVNPIKYQFATPVFMDCDDSLCIDPKKVAKFCAEECKLDGLVLKHKASGKIVKAIVVVHVFGNMADMEAIMDIAEKYNLKVVEDATEALGTYYTTGRYSGKYAGTIGDYGAYSFNGNKIITTGGGGAITAKHVSDTEHIRYLSTQAKDDGLFYIHNEVGYNYRMTNLQAALGVAQLELLPEFIARKQKNYDVYCDLFKDCEYAKVMPFRTGVNSNKWFYSLFINKTEGLFDMHDIINFLDTHRIGTRPIWGLVHNQRPYKNDVSYNIDKAIYYEKHILNIPCSTNLVYQDILKVADCVEKALYLE